MAEKDQLKPSPVRRRTLIAAVCILAVIAALYLMRKPGPPSGTSGQKAGAASPVMPVSAEQARKGDIRIYLTGLGSVIPENTVTVRTRVDGELMKVYFEEGQIVASGQLLAQIDPRPFEAQLGQAEGQLVRDQALLANARLDLQRYQVLYAQNSASKQQLDTQKSLVRQYEGAVRTDDGQVRTARLQLVYSRITSPLGGRIGLLNVDPGNIVHTADTTGLAVITQLQPITVVFSIPEDSLPPLLDRLKEGKRLPVEALNRDQSRTIAGGYLVTVDNLIDQTTGTVRLKARFANENNELFPNQFVNARLLLDTLHGVTVIPAAAVQRSPKGTFVYRIKPDRTVEIRQVSTGPGEGNEVSVTAGLSPGDLVVTEGGDRLREGSRVELLEEQENGASRKGRK